MENILRSSDSLSFAFDPHKQEEQPLDENVVLLRNDIQKEFPEWRWNHLNVGEISIQQENKEIKDEIKQSPRKACFRVHIVKNRR